MTPHFNWNEAATETLGNLYVAAYLNGVDGEKNKSRFVAEALTALNQAFKQAVDAAEPEKKGVLGIKLDEPSKSVVISKRQGFNDATAQYKANMYKQVDGGKTDE